MNWNDQEHFSQKPVLQINFAMLGAWIFGAACWVGIAWAFVWMATDGHRLFNHFIDRIVAAF